MLYLMLIRTFRHHMQALIIINWATWADDPPMQMLYVNFVNGAIADDHALLMTILAGDPCQHSISLQV